MANTLTNAQRQELKDAFDVFDTGMIYDYFNNVYLLFFFK
jgi:hypothetical protein